MPKTNYAHDVRRRRQEFFRERLRDRKQTDLAKALGITPGAMTYKVDRCCFTYEQLVTIFQDKRNFTNEEILKIMGREV